MGLSASTNVEGADKFVEDFGKIIEDGRYHPEQIFNVDETGLSFFWGGGRFQRDPISIRKKKPIPGFKLKPFLIRKIHGH